MAHVAQIIKYAGEDGLTGIFGDVNAQAELEMSPSLRHISTKGHMISASSKIPKLLEEARRIESNQ